MPKRIDAHLVYQTWREQKGNIRATAKQLKISRTTIYKILRHYADLSMFESVLRDDHKVKSY